MTRTLADLLPVPLTAASLAQLQPLTRAADLLTLLDRWVERGWLRALDRAFVAFLREQAPSTQPLVLLAAALTSHQLGHGHVCLDLHATLAAPDFALSLPPEGEASNTPGVLPSQLLANVTGDAWCAALAASELVSDHSNSSPASANESRPLVLAGRRLYLRRYWNYERTIGRILRQRLSVPAALPSEFPERLNALFPRSTESLVDWQKLACALAVRGAFSIVTGGPGTGKTTTVVRLLALLQAPAVEAGAPLRIKLAAPTGKAAARLTESISLQVASLNVAAEVRKHIPAEVTTLHRLLGSRPGTRHFRYHAQNPLPLDVLVVDEASMIDLEMMALLLEALPARARLILLGDKDQLASVEAGAVLSDLCRDAEASRYSEATREWLEAVCGEDISASGLQVGSDAEYPLAQHIAMLRHSRRFGQQSGIGQLALRVNAQQANAARAAFTEQTFADLQHVVLRGERDHGFERLVIEGHAGGVETAAHGYRHYLQILNDQRPGSATALEDLQWQDWARAVLNAFDAFQLLCAVRKGPWGVDAVNSRVTDALSTAGLIDGQQTWYEGRPVLMTRNDYGLGLMNGDIGIALYLPAATAAGSEPDHSVPQVLRVAFPRSDGKTGVRFILPSRLHDVETVYAMTVHKSQGSEFAHTALLLPEALNPVLTKELLYTGITRARDWFTLLETKPGIFEEAVQRKVKRLSGLNLDF